MNIKPMVKGVTLGLAVGSMVYVIAQSTPSQRRTLKRSTGKALRTLGDVLDGIGH